MAEQYWPGQDPIGKRFRIYGLTEPLLEVVGVARNSKYVVVFENTRPFVYLPLERDMKCGRSTSGAKAIRRCSRRAWSGKSPRSRLTCRLRISGPCGRR